MSVTSKVLETQLGFSRTPILKGSQYAVKSVVPKVGDFHRSSERNIEIGERRNCENVATLKY
jgi:hypothetical protein